ncbi:MAG: cyclodeaminase/cyclohydrolase family protein, partial [Proteiniphilum sp.]|nr:cyclodeaminase/cyclohydrolase family protein [Proteiniphilum sp.]
MKLQDLLLKEFLEKTASNEPVPGGGSSAALNA